MIIYNIFFYIIFYNDHIAISSALNGLVEELFRDIFTNSTKCALYLLALQQDVHKNFSIAALDRLNSTSILQ